MRRPEAKEAYQTDMRLQMKKQAWLQERRSIEEQGEQRRLIADALEEAPADLKKLLAPMFHIRVVERYLWCIYDECTKKDIRFIDKLRSEETAEQLRNLRRNFQEGGEERMASLEDQWYGICNDIVKDEEAKKVVVPHRIDVHTLKHLLEFAQECKREGNNKFNEGLYEEALQIYTQADDAMKKWKVEKHLKNEDKWFKDYHIRCLKNKAQAALKLELFQTALDAANDALEIDGEDHKAWYRKLQAEKGLGKFDEAEESLTRLEDIAQWCLDKRQLLKDCEAERKKIRCARAKHKVGTREMLGKAFDTGVFSSDRVALQDDEAAKPAELKDLESRPKLPPPPLERSVTLTAALAGDLLDELADGYAQGWYQARVRKCAIDSNFDKMLFMSRLKGIAFEVQRPILEKWGFEGNEQGVREMTVAIREHGGKLGDGMPAWLKEKSDRARELLYGGREEGGMAAVMV